MRIIPVLAALLFAGPAIANAQSFVVQGSGGPTLTDSGHSMALGVGYSPASRLTFQIDFDRTHLASQLTTDQYGYISGYRGGTFTQAALQMRVSLFERGRIGPYGLVGAARGVGRANPHPTRPARPNEEVASFFLGGGMQVPVRDRVSVFADVRMMLGAVGREGMFGAAPLRAGVAWAF